MIYQLKQYLILFIFVNTSTGLLNSWFFNFLNCSVFPSSQVFGFCYFSKWTYNTYNSRKQTFPNNFDHLIVIHDHFISLKSFKTCLFSALLFFIQSLILFEIILGVYLLVIANCSLDWSPNSRLLLYTIITPLFTFSQP